VSTIPVDDVKPVTSGGCGEDDDASKLHAAADASLLHQQSEQVLGFVEEPSWLQTWVVGVGLGLCLGVSVVVYREQKVGGCGLEDSMGDGGAPTRSNITRLLRGSEGQLLSMERPTTSSRPAPELLVL
jgi:hypothetical protein